LVKPMKMIKITLVSNWGPKSTSEPGWTSTENNLHGSLPFLIALVG